MSTTILRPALMTALLLLVPLVSMQFTEEVAWEWGDFVVGGALLFGAGLTYELISRRESTIAYRCAVGLAAATTLFLGWMNLAVGLIGSEENPADLLYLVVIAIEMIGAAIARLRSRGMARALFATALAQAMVPLIALLLWRPAVVSGEVLPGMGGALLANALFVLLFLGSGLLFQSASSRPVSA